MKTRSDTMPLPFLSPVDPTTFLPVVLAYRVAAGHAANSIG